jgi:GT2 family glycosyltransferase
MDQSGAASHASPLVYVVLLNWHGWRDTVNCLASLRQLDYANHRVLVVDNGSTDDSVARIREAFPQQEILTTGQNLGFAGGNNLGIRYAFARAAEFVWLLNNDTRSDPRALSAMVKVAESGASIGAVGSVIYYLDEPHRVQAWGGGRVYFLLGMCRLSERPVRDGDLHFLSGASVLLRRAALEEVELLDAGFFLYWEDVDLSLRLKKLGWKLAVADDSKVWHKGTGSGSGDSAAFDRYFNASATRFFNRHAPLPVLSHLVGVGGRIAKRALRGDWERVRAVLQGAMRS